MSEKDDQQVTDDQATDQNTQVVESAEDNIEDQLLFGDESSEEESDESESPVEEAETTEETSEKTESDEETQETQEEESKDESETPQETEAERSQRFYEMRQEQKRSREQVEKAVNQNYQPQPVDQLTQHFVDQGYDEFQANMLAREEVRSQRESIAEARAEVAELNSKLVSESVQVMHDFPVFDPKSSEYDEGFAKLASDMYMRAANPVTDPKTGAIVQTNLMPHDFYKELHTMRTMSASKAEAKAKKAVSQQIASVSPQSSSAPISVKRGNSMEELEKRLSNVKF